MYLGCGYSLRMAFGKLLEFIIPLWHWLINVDIYCPAVAFIDGGKIGHAYRGRRAEKQFLGVAGIFVWRQ